MAEVLGSAGGARVLDLSTLPSNSTDGPKSEWMPAYAVYEAGRVVRLGLFNYLSGGDSYVARVSVSGEETPDVVYVK
jgi:hypothetical protein